MNYSIPKLFDLDEFDFFYDLTKFIQNVFELNQMLIKKVNIYNNGYEDYFDGLQQIFQMNDEPC